MHRHQASRTPWAGRILASVSVLAGAVVATAGSPAAADPGANGLIAFTSFRDQRMEVYAIQPDGTGERNLTRFPDAADSHPAWSPDGTRIAFSSNRTGSGDIYVMEPDGSGQTRLTTNPAFDGQPTWSPDGTKIAFASTRLGNTDIYVMNPDGSGVTRVTTNAAADIDPDWQWIDPDQTPPSIVGTVTPPPNGAGWNNQLPVTVTFTCSDEDSGIASCTSPVTIPDQTPGQDESGTAVDNAGNTASTSVTVRADVTPPTVTIDDPPALAGLPVPPACQITGTATDALSGIGDVTVTFTNLLTMATESRSATSLTGSTWAVTTEDLLPGLYSATARSGDVAGNQSAPSREVRFLTLVCLPGPR